MLKLPEFLISTCFLVNKFVTILICLTVLNKHQYYVINKILSHDLPYNHTNLIRMVFLIGYSLIKSVQQMTSLKYTIMSLTMLEISPYM